MLLTCCPNCNRNHCKEGVEYLIWFCFIRHFMVRVLFLLAIWLYPHDQIDTLLLSYQYSVVQIYTKSLFPHATSATRICCHIISSHCCCHPPSVWVYSDLPCAASLAGIQPVRPRAQRTSP